MVSLDCSFNNPLCRIFGWIDHLMLFLLILLRVEFLINLDEIALDFLELIHDGQTLLEAIDLIVFWAQSKWLALDSNQAVKQRVQDETELKVELS